MTHMTLQRTIVAVSVAGLLAVAPGASAQMKVSGSVSLDAIATDKKGEINPYRFDQYKDLSSGAALGADIRGESDKYFLRFFGENIGRDDQFMELTGGQYGIFKYSLYNNNIINNLTYSARTPFSGTGTNNLTFTGTAPSSNPATWHVYDYGIKHENYGGTIERQARTDSPFYLRATANQKETKGLKPVGNPGSSPGGVVIELPVYIDFTTTDASVEAGYATKTSQYSLNASWSSFKSQDDNFRFRNPMITGTGPNTETGTIATDNNLWKIAANAMWKQLPFASSTLALRGSYSKLTNGFDIPLTAVAVSGVNGQTVNTNPNNSKYNGNIVNTSASASLTSQLAKAFDSRIYWNYLEKKNHSTHVVFTPVNAVTLAAAQNCDINFTNGTTGPTCSNELFHYKKNNFGVDLQYRINPANRVSGGLDYTETERERIDYDKTDDTKFYLEWKNTSIEDLSAKIKYQLLHRRSDFLLGNLNPAAGVGTTGVNNLAFNKYLKRFDLADNDQDVWKLVLDWTPRPFLDFGAELLFKDNNYRNVTLGRTKDTREEIYLTASYGDPSKFRVSAFFDFEATRYESNHWVGNINAATFPAPIVPASSTQYMWNGKVKDDNYVIGIGADWPYSERLKFKGSVMWQKTNGSVDLAAQTTATTLQNVPNYDTFRRTTIDVKGTYSFTKEFDATLGLAYDNYKYTDIQFDGYRYTLGTGASTNYFSGAYAFPDYSATLAYLTLKYKFK